MGVSSDGILYFGFVVGDEGQLPEWMGKFEDFADFVLDKAGLDPDDRSRQGVV